MNAKDKTVDAKQDKKEASPFKTQFDAFANDSQSTTAGPSNGLTFENSTESVTVYGDMTIDKDSKPEEIDELVDVLLSIKAKLKIKK